MLRNYSFTINSKSEAWAGLTPGNIVIVHVSAELARENVIGMYQELARLKKFDNKELDNLDIELISTGSYCDM